MSEQQNATNHEGLKEMYEKFKAPFPPEAYQADTSRGFELTTVKAQYVVERLNDVMNFHNWRIEGKYDKQENGSVLFEGQLVLFLGDYLGTAGRDSAVHIIPTVGYSDKKKNIGDAYKGARTDALSKAASYLGIANDVFKGLVGTGGTKKATKATNKKPASFQGKKATKVSGDF